MKNININDYVEFNPNNGKFELSSAAQKILIHKDLMKDADDCNEWCHTFFRMLLDLYSGCASREVRSTSYFDVQFREGYQKEVIEWTKKHKKDAWFSKAADALVNVINETPFLYEIP